MNNQTILLKIKEALNKLDSSDYDNIEAWQIIAAFNTAQSLFTRRNLHGLNIPREGDEQSTSRIDDFQVLITVSPNLLLTQRKGFYEADVPVDYLRFKRVSSYATSDCCSIPRKLVVYLGEDGNTDLLLRDKNKQPSFEWAETFGTFLGEKLRLYTNDLFKLQDTTLIYYKQPPHIEIAGVADPYTGITAVVDVPSVFKDDLIEVMIKEAAENLAANIESGYQAQRGGAEVEKNN